MSFLAYTMSWRPERKEIHRLEYSQGQGINETHPVLLKAVTQVIYNKIKQQDWYKGSCL